MTEGKEFLKNFLKSSREAGIPKEGRKGLVRDTERVSREDGVIFEGNDLNITKGLVNDFGGILSGSSSREQIQSYNIAPLADQLRFMRGGASRDLIPEELDLIVTFSNMLERSFLSNRLVELARTRHPARLLGNLAFLVNNLVKIVESRPRDFEGRGMFAEKRKDKLITDVDNHSIAVFESLRPLIKNRDPSSLEDIYRSSFEHVQGKLSSNRRTPVSDLYLLKDFIIAASLIGDLPDKAFETPGWFFGNESQSMLRAPEDWDSEPITSLEGLEAPADWVVDIHRGEFKYGNTGIVLGSGHATLHFDPMAMPFVLMATDFQMNQIGN